MPDIPLYHFTPHSAGPSNVRADPRMLDAQYAAGARVGRSVAGVGDVLADAALKIQDAAEFRQRTELDSAMRDAWTNYQGALNPSSDETKWADSWTRTLDEVGKDRLAKASGRNRPQLDALLANFKAATLQDVVLQAKGAGVKKATDAATYRLEQAWREGDTAGASQILDEMAAHGLVYAEAIPAMKRKGEQAMERQVATAAIESDPVAAHDSLTEKTEGGRWKNFTALDEDDRLTLINHARTQTTAVQTANYQDLIDDLNNQVVRTPEQLQGMVDKRLITPKQRKSYESAYRHGGYNTDPAVSGALFTEINAYDPQKDPDQTQRASLLGRIATTGFPQNTQSEMNSLLGEKADPKNVLNAAVAKNAFEDIDHRFKLGIYGKYETKSFDPGTGQWTTKVDAKVFESALGTKNRIDDATRKFFRENPKATAEQANRFVSELQAGETAKAGRAIVLSGLGAPAAPVVDDDAKARKKRLDAILERK